MRAARAHAIASTLNARFSLSLYCSRCLYSVTSRRWTNDQWLGRSSKQAGQTLIVLSATHVSVDLPFEGESSTTPLTVFLACILYFCHLFPSSFSTVSRHVRRSLGQARPRHRIHHAAWHASQTTCHFQTLVTYFILFLSM